MVFHDVPEKLEPRLISSARGLLFLLALTTFAYISQTSIGNPISRNTNGLCNDTKAVLLSQFAPEPNENLSAILKDYEPEHLWSIDLSSTEKQPRLQAKGKAHLLGSISARETSSVTEAILGNVADVPVIGE